MRRHLGFFLFAPLKNVVNLSQKFIKPTFSSYFYDKTEDEKTSKILYYTKDLVQLFTKYLASMLEGNER